MRIRDILVPVDFSAASIRCLERALEFVDSDGGAVSVLTVVDQTLIDRIVEAGLGTAEAIEHRLRQRAVERMDRLMQRPVVADARRRGVQVEPMVAVGTPFAEILRLAEDMDFALLVLAVRGSPRSGLEKLLFGSTTEKVLRAATIPVLCLPDRPIEGLEADSEQPGQQAAEGEVKRP